jgi:hypothetical protein
MSERLDYKSSAIKSTNPSPEYLKTKEIQKYI